MTFPIIKRAYVWLIASLVVMAGALWLFASNMRYSIQFTGGMEVVLNQPSIAEQVVPTLNTALSDKGYQNFTAAIGKKDNHASLLLQIQLNEDEQVDEVTELVQDTLLATNTIKNKEEILELSIIWPSIGEYIKKSAKSAIIVSTILMAVYILFAFAGMREMVSPFLLGVVTIFTMLFDVSIASWAYGFLMMVNSSVQIDTIFIIALLTVMGYSVNDTIIIFDRIRENYLNKKAALAKHQVTGEEIFEMSLWQTMRRSLATSGSTLLAVVCMYIFGTGILRMFAFTLGLGVIAGTYSSIFLAAPLAYLLSNLKSQSAK